MTSITTDGLKERLKTLRKSRKLSQDALEALSGVNRNTIAKIETQPSRHPSPDSIAALALHLGSTYEYLMYGITAVDHFSPSARALLIRIDNIKNEDKKRKMIALCNGILDL